MYGLCFADSIDGLGFPVVPVGTEFSPGSLEVLSVEGVVESSALINEGGFEVESGGLVDGVDNGASAVVEFLDGSFWEGSGSEELTEGRSHDGLEVLDLVGGEPLVGLSLVISVLSFESGNDEVLVVHEVGLSAVAGLGEDTGLWVWGAVSGVELGHVDGTEVIITSKGIKSSSGVASPSVRSEESIVLDVAFLGLSAVGAAEDFLDTVGFGAEDLFENSVSSVGRSDEASVVGGVDGIDFFPEELVLVGEEREMVELPLVVVVVRPGDWSVLLDLLVGDEGEEIVDDHLSIDNWGESGFEGDLGGSVSGSSGGLVGGISDLFSGVLSEAVDGVAALELEDELGGVLADLGADSVVDSHAHDVDLVVEWPGLFEDCVPPDGFTGGGGARENGFSWVTTEDWSVLLSPLHSALLILETEVGSVFLAIFEFWEEEVSEHAKSVSDRDDHDVLLDNHIVSVVSVETVVSSATVEVVDKWDTFRVGKGFLLDGDVDGKTIFLGDLLLDTVASVASAHVTPLSSVNGFVFVLDEDWGLPSESAFWGLSVSDTSAVDNVISVKASESDTKVGLDVASFTVAREGSELEVGSWEISIDVIEVGKLFFDNFFDDFFGLEEGGSEDSLGSGLGGFESLLGLESSKLSFGFFGTTELTLGGTSNLETVSDVVLVKSWTTGGCGDDVVVLDAIIVVELVESSALIDVGLLGSPFVTVGGADDVVGLVFFILDVGPLLDGTSWELTGSEVVTPGRSHSIDKPDGLLGGHVVVEPTEVIVNNLKVVVTVDEWTFTGVAGLSVVTSNWIRIAVLG